MEVSTEQQATGRRSLFTKLGEKKSYSSILIFSRLIFAACQLSVSLDTWSHFKKLSRIPKEGNYDLSLNTLINYNGDLSWVPTITKNIYSDEKYGANKLFNLYLIRLSHYFHRRITYILLYLSCIIFSILILLSLLDLFLMFQSERKKENLRTPSLFVRTLLYSCLFGLVFSQFVFVLYYRTSLCSLETLYRELFYFPTERPMRFEFLDGRTCKMTHRFVATYVMSFLTLLPDTFLMVVAIIPPLRIHSVVNGTKYFASIFFLITALLTMDFRRYLSVGLHPTLLDYGLRGLQDQVPTTPKISQMLSLAHSQKSFKMYNIKDSITLQVGRALKEYSKGGPHTLEPRYVLNEKAATAQNLIAHFNFSKQIFAQWKHSSQYYMYFSIYTAFTSVVDALSGTVMVIKRHRFLIPLIAILNFIYFFTNLVHCIMVQFPMIQSRFICRIKMYTPDETGLGFETLALSDLMCKIADLYISSFTMIIVLVVISLGNILNLYLLRNRK